MSAPVDFQRAIRTQVDSPLRVLFPDDVIVVSATGTARPPPLLPAEEPFVRHAVERRRREFASGRACARKALARMGLPELPLLPGKDRAPLWPPGVVGSISHCHGFCAAVVAHRGRVLGLGVDAEQAGPMDPSMIPLVCTPRELSRMGRRRDPERAKVIFSAKESAFKCYYPLAGTVLDFQDVEIDLADGDGMFRARLVREDTPSARGVRVFRGRFARAGAFWLTGVILDAEDLEAAAGRLVGSCSARSSDQL